MSELRGYLEIVGIFFVSLLLFLWGVGAQEVIGFDSRFYLFALEMWRHGVTWFPTTYQQPYPDYPVTSTLLIYMFAGLFGSLNKLTAILPTAIAAALTVLMTYFIAILHNKRWGLFSVCLLLMTVAFLKSGRSISIDLYPTLITTVCFYLVYSADQKDLQGRVGWIYVLFLLGFAFRGPIGLIIPTGVVCTYYAVDKNFKAFFFSGVFALLILIFCSLVFLTIAKGVGNDAFVHNVIAMEAMGRMQSSNLPYYFYAKESLGAYALSFPLAGLVSIGILYYSYRLHRHTTDLKLLTKLMGWALVILVGMSIPGDKKIRYVLPMVPALAMLAAYPLVSSPREKYFAALRKVFMLLFLFLPSLLFLGLMLFHHYTSKHAIMMEIYYSRMSTFLITAQSISFALSKHLKKYEYLREVSIVLISTLCFAITYLVEVERLELYIDRTRELVVQVETERLAAHANLVFYKEDPDGLPIKYLINMWRDDMPIFIQHEPGLLAYNAPMFVVTSLEYYATLPASVTSRFHVVAIDKIGHASVVVFTNR